MPSTLPKFLREKFKVKKWCWYIVDVRDWYNPVIVRKHFNNRKQVKEFIKLYGGNGFEYINGIEALRLGVKELKGKSKRRHGIARKPKYHYPPNCITQYDRQLFRNNERRRMKTDRERPKVSKTIAWEIINDSPVKFTKRLKKWRNFHWAYSNPVQGLEHWRNEYDDMVMVVKLTNIVRCLQKYYDVGPYHVDEVAEVLYKIFKKRIDKYLNPDPQYGPRLQNVEKEFIARGFKPIFEINPDTEEDNYVESIGLMQIYVYPEMCWHQYSDKELYDHYIYDLQAKVGIPGYTRAHVAGLNKRK